MGTEWGATIYGCELTPRFCLASALGKTSGKYAHHGLTTPHRAVSTPSNGNVGGGALSEPSERRNDLALRACLRDGSPRRL